MDENQIKLDISTVCRCKGIRYKTIRMAIQNGADSIEKIRKYTKASTGCGESCLAQLTDMLQKYSVKKSGK
ncbi:MAG: (2Fe-2S)-binding protein [Oligoflexales bacterium]|nr:(2Fe-2S)-binding protein [Oligoflexales bacterium]